MPELSQVIRSLPSLTDGLVYAAIAIVTLTGVLKCLLPLWSTTHAVRQAIRRLQDNAGAKNPREIPVWQESRFMGKRLRGSWLRFLQNAEQLDRRGLPCNVEDYINDDTVTHGPGNATLAELIPNLLTSLGILGTFLGMMKGLSGLNMEDAAGLMTGIPTLLGGMQFAFGTSVAGISCSLVFNMLNRIAQGSSYRAIDDFVENFTSLAMNRPLDNDVQLICQNQDRNHMLGEVTDTLPGQMAGAVEHAVTKTLTPVAQSMDHFLAGTTHAQIEGVNAVVNQFVARMNASLRDQFLELGQTLAELNRQQRETAERMGTSMAASDLILNDAQKLHSLAADVMDRFEQYASTLQHAAVRDEEFERKAGEVISGLQSAAVMQAQAMSDLNSMRQKSERQSADLQQQIGQIRQLLDSMTAKTKEN